MADDNAAGPDMIEFGDVAPAGIGWLTAATGAPAPPPVGEPAPPRPRQRLNYGALGLAAAGFLGMLAAEYLPWARIDTAKLPGLSGDDLTGRYDFVLGQLPTSATLSYNGAMVLGLAAVAVTLVARPMQRRGAVAAAIGLIAGQLVMIVGLGATIKAGTWLGGLTSLATKTGNAISYGPGYTVATVAALLLVAAAGLAARGPLPARTKENKAGAEAEGPADLMVIPMTRESDGTR